MKNSFRNLSEDYFRKENLKIVGFFTTIIFFNRLAVRPFHVDRLTASVILSHTLAKIAKATTKQVSVKFLPWVYDVAIQQAKSSSLELRRIRLIICPKFFTLSVVNLSSVVYVISSAAV